MALSFQTWVLHIQNDLASHLTCKRPWVLSEHNTFFWSAIYPRAIKIKSPLISGAPTEYVGEKK